MFAPGIFQAACSGRMEKRGTSGWLAFPIMAGPVGCRSRDTLRSGPKNSPEFGEKTLKVLTIPLGEWHALEGVAGSLQPSQRSANTKGELSFFCYWDMDPVL
jgi:hypothetical protein